MTQISDERPDIQESVLCILAGAPKDSGIPQLANHIISFLPDYSPESVREQLKVLADLGYVKNGSDAYLVLSNPNSLKDSPEKENHRLDGEIIPVSSPRSRPTWEVIYNEIYLRNPNLQNYLESLRNKGAGLNSISF